MNSRKKNYFDPLLFFLLSKNNKSGNVARSDCIIIIFVRMSLAAIKRNFVERFIVN